MSTVAIASPWIIMIALGGLGSFTAVGAPLPLDPVLSQIAPEQCLWYSSTAGSGTPDPASSNHTEQLFAEPQVQRFMTELETQITSALRRAGGPAREQRVVAAEGPKLVKLLLSRPMAMYVEEVKPGPDGGVHAAAAIVLSAGDQKKALADSLGQLLSLATEKGLKLTTETSGGIDWQRVELPRAAPAVRFGWKDDYFIVAVGDDTPTKVLERMGMGGSTPQWLTELRAEHPVEREMTIGYIDVAGILERVRPLVEAKDPKAWPIIERLGLTSIKAVHAVGGYDATGCVSMVHLATDGTRPGLLQFIPYKRLEQDDLAIIPKDALAAMAISMDLGEAIDQGVALISQFEPRAREDYDRTMWEIEAHLGVNVRDEVLATLGDAWVVYLPGGDLMSSWLNSAAAVRVKDPARLRTAAAKLIEAAKAEMARNDERVSIVSSDASGNTIYSLQFQGEPIPFAPSLCISDRWMVVGLLPQAVQSAVDRQREDSLAESESMAEAFTGVAGPAGPASIFYQDTPQLVRSAYPFVQMGVQMASGALRQQGIVIDTTALPSAETIVKHLRPTVSTLRHESDGFHAITHGSLPGGAGAVGTAPFLAGLLVPAVGSARTAAREAQEINHLKQLVLGFLNYESARGRFVTDVYDAEGKPLLSWRVQLLPYMEGMALYEQIRKDEPWDSEHNRQFHDMMPEVFKSPSSPRETSRTRFVALKGPQTLMPGNQELSFRDVTDGTSNTVLFVQADPESAVNWMQPADLEFNPEHPFAGVMQPAGYFAAAFCDGSVRRLSLGIGGETMKGLVTRNGGEITTGEDAPPAPELYEESAAHDYQAEPVGSP